MCASCKSALGVIRSHGEGVPCPVQASLWCSTCSCKGHRKEDCTIIIPLIWRPIYLEDLITPDIKARWGINTQTLIIWSTPSDITHANKLRSVPVKIYIRTISKSSLKIARSHTDGVGCPVLASEWCSTCSSYGHKTVGCSEVITWIRPTYIEDLIHEDLKIRWGIKTQTLILWPSPSEMTLEDKEREIGEGSIIEIRYGGPTAVAVKLDAALRVYMKAQRPKIETVHKMEGNLLKVRLAAVAVGKKIRIIKEE